MIKAEIVHCKNFGIQSSVAALLYDHVDLLVYVNRAISWSVIFHNSDEMFRNEILATQVDDFFYLSLQVY